MKNELKELLKYAPTTNPYQFLVQWVILALSLLAVIGTISYSLANQYDLIESEVQSRLEILTKVLDENMAHQLNATNIALVDILRDPAYRKKTRDGKLLANLMLRTMCDAMPGVRTINILDAEGNIRASNRDELIGRNFSEREYFKVPRQHPEPSKLYVSSPFKTVLGVYGMTLSRVITGSEGEFDGIITATLDADYFTVLLNSILYAPDMRASVIHGDGKVFSIAPAFKDVEEMELAKPGSFFTHHVKSKQTFTLFKRVPYSAGDKRMVAMRTVTSDKFIGDNPLIVVASRDHSAIFASWRHETFEQAGLFGLLALVAGFGMYFLQRRQREFTRIETSYDSKLKESESRWKFAIEGSGDGVWDVNIQTDDANYSKRWKEMLGYAETDILPIRQEWLTRIHPDDQSHVAKAMRDYLDGKSATYVAEYRLRCKDESYKWILSRGMVVNYSEDGNPLRMIGTDTDITERKLREEDRTKLEGQLQQSQKMDSVGRLAGGVAHDFNNMLTVIQGHANLALMEIDSTHPLHAALEEIRKAAERSADLTRQLLAFARKQIVAPKVLDLNETVSGMLKMLRRLIGEDIQLAWLPAANLWPIKIDPSQIDQILANLCVNARDSIADVGKITIETGNSFIDEEYCANHAGFVPGMYVLLTVNDNGCGMDTETLSHIFEPFFTTKDVGEGTGLGLATVYGIVKQNNGFINIYSERGFGSSFAIYLPRHMGETRQTRTEGSAEPSPRGQETVLLVEDELAILKMTSMILTKQGYTVLQANSPSEAIRMASECNGKIHLLITDVVMPMMNGQDLAKNLLSLQPQIKCLFMSGYTANVIAHHGVLDDGVHFIQKPFTLPGLAIKVREVLDN
ncbi:MAG: PAS domain-containing protein [Desulfuromonadaceae bacterium]|nr:PAS domain-containing protein [Desulfuromonadaceae bacterium]